jgi:hypothetical protein
MRDGDPATGFGIILVRFDDPYTIGIEVFCASNLLSTTRYLASFAPRPYCPPEIYPSALILVSDMAVYASIPREEALYISDHCPIEIPLIIYA